MTLIQLIRQASGELGLTQPQVAMSSTNLQTIQMLSLTQRLLKDLRREHEWQRLVTAYVFQTVASISVTGDLTVGSTTVANYSAGSLQSGDILSGTGISQYTEIVSFAGADFIISMPATASATGSTMTRTRQDYVLPSDFDRMIGDTNWDRSNYWQNVGPKSPQEWQTLTGGIISTGPRMQFRIYKNYLRLWPAPTTVMNVSYEYVSKTSVTADGDDLPTKDSFTVDSDTCVFPDDLMLAGIKYYFLKAKKLDFGAEMAEYAEILATRKGQDQPSSVASLTPRPAPFLITPGSIPEGNWDL